MELGGRVFIDISSWLKFPWSVCVVEQLVLCLFILEDNFVFKKITQKHWFFVEIFHFGFSTFDLILRSSIWVDVVIDLAFNNVNIVAALSDTIFIPLFDDSLEVNLESVIIVIS